MIPPLHAIECDREMAFDSCVIPALDLAGGPEAPPVDPVRSGDVARVAAAGAILDIPRIPA